MEYTMIPHLESKVSRVGLGTWAIGGSLWGGTDEKEAIKAIHTALDKEVNFIDTAPGYGKGESERIVGKALKAYGKRDQIIIGTKVGLNQEFENKVFRDSRKKSILKEIEDSLQRLQVDYIDLYQVHWPDPKTPISETAETLKGLMEQGKIRAIGVSNYSLEQIEEFRQVAPLSSDQFDLNIFERENEKEILPYCHREHLTSVAYSSLCRGLLSGKMTTKREFKGDDLRKGMDPKFKEPHFSEYVQCAQALESWVQDKYKQPLIALAVRWVLDKGVNIALWGARDPGQLKELGSVFGWKLTPADFEEIDKIVIEHVKHPVDNSFMAPPVRE